jgi:hypothetical protein
MTAQPIARPLLDWRPGNDQAVEQLTPLVYEELRKLAGTYLRRERPHHTLHPTALVHEAYLRLVEQDHQNWESRSPIEEAEAAAAQRSQQLIALDDAPTGLGATDPRKASLSISREMKGGATA